MKRIIAAIIIIASIGIQGQAQTQQRKINDLIGIWEFTGEQNSGAYLEIIDSSTIILSYNGERKKILDYKIDFKKSPIWFDFSTNDTSSVVAVKSLLEVMNDNLMKWQLFVDEERTPFFSSTKGELIYLRKAKQSIPVSTIASNN